jgi:hypothetical protein
MAYDYKRGMSVPDEPAQSLMSSEEGSESQSLWGNDFFSDLICEDPAAASEIIGPVAGPSGGASMPGRPGAMPIEDYLATVEEIEQHYRDTAEGEYDSGTTVAGMRALYGYEGDLWEKMIPDAPNVAAPTAEDVPGVENLFNHDETGARKDGRLVELPDGSLIDPGHIYTGIDAIQHPDAHAGIDAYGIESEDGATWSGDVGQAMVLYDESWDKAAARSGIYDAPMGGLTVGEAMENAASRPDLDGDLDGVVLGRHFDSSQSLTDQMSSYYTDPDADLSYEHRYSEFMETQGMEWDENGLTEESVDTVRTEVDDFAELYSHRSSEAEAFVGLAGSEYDQDAEESTSFTDRFIDYLEEGLWGED